MKRIFTWRRVLKGVVVVLLLMAVFFSATTARRAFSDPKNWDDTLQYLEGQKSKVLTLTASAATAATALAAIPSDTTTPVADEIADITSSFLIVLAAIMLERLIVALSGPVAFGVLVPAIFVFAAIGIVWRKGWAYDWAIKFFILALALLSVVPLGVQASKQIERMVDFTYETAADDAQQLTEEIEESTDEEGNFLERVWNKITGSVTSVVDKGKELLNRFLESVAELIVVTCGIPIAVLIFLIWLMKEIFHFNIHVKLDRLYENNRRLLPRRGTKGAAEETEKTEALEKPGT